MTESQSRPNPILRRLPLIVIVLAAIAGFWMFRDTLTFDTLRENRAALLAFRDANYLLCVLGFIAAYAAIVAFSLPGGTIATLTGGFLFGQFPQGFPVLPGVIYNVTGATLGAIALFLAARWGLGDALSRRMEASDGLVKRIKDGIDENQWSMLFLIRLLPAVPFFVANLVPALVGVPLFRYAISTFFGIMPGALVFTSVGAGLSQVFDRGETPDLGIIFEPQILLPILGLCVLAALPIILKAVRGKKGV
ncbi:TVP38/TMEM64 family protein [Salipiger sp. IMCC34102]|uniref:TVP38/TMEM64 family protein n=1 Tax=Salipiger sp. IMCC34102 TaxID=2510647 RepID=UPI00101CF6D5|nr:TVP38/TMEM64 family protein [Salipiger sp. IMCC34102]RYH04413.1 TVP38/TMEM64 family protein [Salipiger sp. IMCC34102]